MSEKEIEVVVSGDTLTLKGEKKQEKKIAADFSKGVLTVTMPKTAKTVEQQKKIEVKTAS